MALRDGSVRWGYFRRALKAMNPKIVLEPPRNPENPGAMVYLRIPRHPESDPLTGLWEVLAVPSPCVFKTIPKYDTEHNGKWVRGWATFFKSVRQITNPLTGKPVFNEKLVKYYFPGVFDRFSTKAFKAELREKNKTREEKINDKLRYKPF